MKIDLLYGRNGISVNLPEAAEPTVINKPAFPPCPDATEQIATALTNPVAGADFKSLCQNRSSACILICDITRPVPNHLFLRPMIEGMIDAGIPKSEITVLIATGLHRPNLGEELAELVGDPWVLENVAVENHYALNDEDHIDLGTTKGRGVPVKLDRRLVDADLRIATGLVEPHFMAGYSGGRKVVAPGVAHHETIRTFHSARFMEDPAAKECNLVDNPLHEEQLEIVRMLGEIYALNTVIDEDRNLVFTSFGEIIESHLAAVEFVRAFTEIPVGRKFKTVVTSAAGYPLDQTYYQTVKGMVTPLDILAPDGTLIIASHCGEGVGSDHFRAAQERLVSMGPDAFLKSLLAKSFADVDEWQTEMQLKPMRAGKVVLYSEGLPESDFAVTGVERATDLKQAIADSIAMHADPEIAVIPEGPYVVPQARSAA
ncbi:MULTISPECIES: nickel-dependent lactate racemase [Halocynthiibacter]|uniref:Nickel-dependent lactate racemase n=1 Tax=Halocynthiibacter halioticoli TaxID=2986804 RepID=A0AAE3LRI6_9RHOB|nr:MULTISPECIES: nickel-dependent lactate racemase [Halocynthiibacter]MCV6824489.1 nickel-dependent lactate racemase [Halocynthiibacter halioticoli]MCW4057490.1 nickel-dependent lactate racemase [Halocynthiibacter sp. SDUM655004]